MQSGTKVVILYGACAALFALVLLVMTVVGVTNAFVVVFTDLVKTLPEHADSSLRAVQPPIGPSLPDFGTALAGGLFRFAPPDVHLAPADGQWPWFRVCWQVAKWLNVRPYF